MRLTISLLALGLLSACVSTPQQAIPEPPPRPVQPTMQVPPSTPVVTRPSAGVPAPRILEGPGLGGIIREPAAVLVGRFGEPRLDVREGDMRKLQFTGQPCVLDIFLYPLAPGAEPVATWVEARRASDGAEVDRLACIQALSRRG